jgi:O-antigen/teichoic acid export membrane protein
VRVIRHVYIYFITYFFSAAISFGTIWLLTKNLQPHDYGIINLYSAFITLLTPFITGGILYPLSIEYYKRKPEEYRQFFTNAQAIPLVSVLLFTAICILFQNPLAHFLRVTPVWVILLPVTTWWIMNNEITMMMCRVKNKPWGFALVAIGKNLVEVLLTIGLVIGLNWAWEGRLLSAVIAPIIIGLFSIRIFYRWHFVSNKIEWKKVQHIAWVSIPFIFERLTVFVLANSDKYFIDKFDLNATAKVGLYSVGAQIATIISLVILSMNSAYQPYVFQNLANNHKEKAKKSTWLYIAGAAALVGLVFLGIPILFRFFIGHQYEGAQIYAYYLCGGYFMWGVYNAFLAYLLFHGRNRLITYLSLGGMMVSVVMNFILVPKYGAYGAAITSIVTYSFMALLSVIYSRRYFL